MQKEKKSNNALNRLSKSIISILMSILISWRKFLPLRKVSCCRNRKWN